MPLKTSDAVYLSWPTNGYETYDREGENKQKIEYVGAPRHVLDPATGPALFPPTRQSPGNVEHLEDQVANGQRGQVRGRRIFAESQPDDRRDRERCPEFPAPERYSRYKCWPRRLWC